MAEPVERRPPKTLQKQTEFEETDDDNSTHSPSSDQSDNTITAGTETPGIQSSGESPKSTSPEDCKSSAHMDHVQQPSESVQIVIKSTRYPLLQTKTKSLRRSAALCCETDEDGSPPPENHTMQTDTSSDVLSLPPPSGRNRLEEEGSQSSEAGTSLSSSRDSSVDIPYTDSTGIDLEDFIKKTLNKTPKDRKILLKLETDLIKFVKEPEHLFLKFPPMSSYDRMLVHRVAAYFGLDHNIDQTGRCVIVNKTPSTRLPEFSFQEHIQDVDTQVGKKQILKRNGSLEETHTMEKPHLSRSSRTKSLEERLQEYNETRARIFKSPQASIEDPQLNIMRKLSRPASLGGSKEDLGSRPWSSTDSSSGYGTDSSVKSRVPITKAGSFGGFSNSHSVKTGIFRGNSLQKTDSISSGTSSCLGSPMPTIPCTPPRNSVSVASPHSAGSNSSSTSVQSPLQNNTTGMTSPVQVRSQYFLVISGYESIPAGSMIIDPQTGQIYLNADGTIYRHNPNQTLPASVSFNPAAPVFSQHQFMMDTRQYPDSSSMSELSQQLASVNMTQQQQTAPEALGEMPPGTPRQILYGNSTNPAQIQTNCAQPTAAYQQGYPAAPGVANQPFRYMLPVPLLPSGQQQAQNPASVPIDNQGTSQPGTSNVGQYHQTFITGMPSYSYQPVTSQPSSDGYANTNYAPQQAVGQMESAISGYTSCPSNYPSYGQNSYNPQTPQYFTVAASNPQMGYNFNNTATYRPTTPPSQVPVSTPNVPLNVGPSISIGQPTGSSPTANAAPPHSQYVPYHNYAHYAQNQPPRAPNTQIMQFSTTQVHPSAAQSYPVMRPNMQINMPIPPQQGAAGPQAPQAPNQSSANAQGIHTSPLCIKNLSDLNRLQPKVSPANGGGGVCSGGGGANSGPLCGNMDSGLSEQTHACNKDYTNNTANITGPGGGTVLRPNAGDSMRFIGPSGFRPQIQPLQLNHQRTRPTNCQYNTGIGILNSTSGSLGNKSKIKKCRSISKDCCAGSQSTGGNEGTDSRGVAGSNVLEVYDLCPNLRQMDVEKLLKDLTCQGATLHYVPHENSNISTDTSNLQVSDCKTILAIFPSAPCANRVLQSIPTGRYKLRSTVSKDSISQKSERDPVKDNHLSQASQEATVMFSHSYLRLNSRISLIELTVAASSKKKTKIASFLHLSSSSSPSPSPSLLSSKTSLRRSLLQQTVAAPAPTLRRRRSQTSILQTQGSLRSYMAGNLDGCVNSTMRRWPNAILFGDSITQYGFSHDGCWVALIANLLQRKCDIINRGFSGYNSRWCKKILPHILSPEDLRDTAFVTVFLGANDCGDKDINPLQHIPLDEYQTNMCDIVKEFKRMGMAAEKIILIGPPAVDEETWAKECEAKGRSLSNFNKNTSLYAEACSKAAQQTGTHCVDLYTEMLKLEEWKSLLNDGLHLSNKGSHLLFSLLRPIVEKQTSHLPFKLPYWADVDPDNLDTLLE